MSEMESAITRHGRAIRSSLTGRAYLSSAEKRYFDEVGAKILLPVALPIIKAAALAVEAYDHEYPYVTLPRVGYGDVEFGQYKIRSMTMTSEASSAWNYLKQRDDKRITPIGKIIRKLSVDELPQLYNVREGTMSLVGPRPKSRAEYEAYGTLDEEFMIAYSAARPGITGLEQIGGRAEMTVDDRIEAAKAYASEASVSLDSKILRDTIRAVLGAGGAY